MLTLNIKIQLRKNYNIIMKVSMFLSMRPKVHLHAVVAKFLKKSKKSNIKRAKNCKRAREQEKLQERKQHQESGKLQNYTNNYSATLGRAIGKSCIIQFLVGLFCNYQYAALILKMHLFPKNLGYECICVSDENNIIKYA